MVGKFFAVQLAEAVVFPHDQVGVVAVEAFPGKVIAVFLHLNVKNRGIREADYNVCNDKGATVREAEAFIRDNVDDGDRLPEKGGDKLFQSFRMDKGVEDFLEKGIVAEIDAGVPAAEIQKFLPVVRGK